MKTAAFALCLALLASLATAQTSAQSNNGAAVDDVKNRAAGIAGVMRGVSPVFEDGQLQRNADGTATQERTTSGSAQKQMDFYKQATGVDGMQATATPAAKGATAGATTSVTTYVDFSCATESMSRKAASGYVIQLRGCSAAGNVVGSVKLQVCSALSRGGACDASAFGDVATVAAGTYETVDGVRLGLGCNDVNGACRLTVTNSYSMTVAGEDLDRRTEAQRVSGGADSNSAQGALTEMLGKRNSEGKLMYAQAMADHGQAAVDCVQENQRRQAAGQQPLTCDGKTEVNTGVQSTGSADCSKDALCIRKAVKESTFQRSCSRTFPLTSKVCTLETKTTACDITWVPEVDAKTGKPTGAYLESSSCTATELEGATLFHSFDKEACGYTETRGAGETASEVCAKHNRTDYYAWPSEQVGSCVGEPYRVGGSCIEDPKHTDLQCPSNVWFGRTKTAAECTVADMADPDSVPMEVGDSVIDGCGVCQSAKVGYTCYADPSSVLEVDPSGVDTCSAMDLTGCSLTSTEMAVADETGLVTSQRENYTCTRQQETCVEFKQDDRCLSSDITFGLDKARHTAANSDEAMNQALAGMAVANALGSAATDAEQSDKPMIPPLFDGKNLRCEQPTGSWGSSGVYMDCCKISLQRPGGKFGKLNSCTEDNARLAAARRANYTVYLGDWCSKKMPWPLKKCIQRTQSYCAFPGVLPRLIHEQGRAQLAQMASSASTAEVKKQSLSFPYYGDKGEWTEALTVNGVTLHAWKWPKYCRSLAEAEQVLLSDPLAKECPVMLTNHMAVCENAAGCGPLPEYPELGAERWRLSTADPLKNVTTAVSRYAVVTGACDPASSQCQYEVSAWPAGVGGRAVVSKQLVFAVFAPSSEAKPGSTTVPGQLSNVGDYMFQTISHVASSASPALPATVPLRFSADGGQSWTMLNVPTTNNRELALPGTDAVLSGACSAETNLCHFNMTGTATVTAHPWGTPQNPECGGFTAGQISVMDFGKMDFSEWLSQVMADIRGPNGSSLATMAQTQVAQFNQAFQGGEGKVSLAAPQGQQVARVTPAEGFGPFTATLKVGGYWPVTQGDPAKDTDAITSVQVDWGDCTSPETATFVSQVNGQPARGFLAKHEFTRPQDVPVACGGGEKNVVHTVKLTLATTKSGVQRIELRLENAFANMPGALRTSSGASANNTPVSSGHVPGKGTSPTGP